MSAYVQCTTSEDGERIRESGLVEDSDKYLYGNETYRYQYIEQKGLRRLRHFGVGMACARGEERRPLGSLYRNSWI